MVTGSGCRGVKEDGAPCRARRVRDGEYCFWHDPEHTEEAAEARRLGGLRRRKERTVEGAYDLDGLDDVQLARRWIEIAAADTLVQENSIARSRTLAYLAQVALRLHEQDIELERLKAGDQGWGAAPGAPIDVGALQQATDKLMVKFSEMVHQRLGGTDINEVAARRFGHDNIRPSIDVVDGESRPVTEEDALFEDAAEEDT